MGLFQDIIERLLSFGYNRDEITVPLTEGEQTNPIRSCYYLIAEMFQREEEKIKKVLNFFTFLFLLKLKIENGWWEIM